MSTFFHCSDFTPIPWKNGGGVTQEVACSPTGLSRGDFDWRISIASIAAPGPFSNFPGVDRIITLLDGGGVHLRSDDGQVDHRLDVPLQPFAFAGDIALGSELLGTASRDFNVMTRRKVCQARVSILRAAEFTLDAATGLLLGISGRWQLQSPVLTEGNRLLGADEGLWWDRESSPRQLTPQGADAVLLAVAIDWL
jgi:environmental stress-induced protein Ves